MMTSKTVLMATNDPREEINRNERYFRFLTCRLESMISSKILSSFIFRGGP